MGPEWRQGDQSGVRRWWLSQDDELWFVQGYILKVVPIEISKAWDVEVEGKESQG